MRIERVDDTTVKLFITYSNIEARGFSREDLWTNRKRGEEFFWSMMDEINEEEDFVVEGPLWIQYMPLKRLSKSQFLNLKMKI